jgi:hypothetical protein
MDHGEPSGSCKPQQGEEEQWRDAFSYLLVDAAAWNMRPSISLGTISLTEQLGASPQDAVLKP